METKNLCTKCNNPVGNNVFTVCDYCWDNDSNALLTNWDNRFSDGQATLKKKFWYLIHNLISHPLLCFNTKWSGDFHDWTANKF